MFKSRLAIRTVLSIARLVVFFFCSFLHLSFSFSRLLGSLVLQLSIFACVRLDWCARVLPMHSSFPTALASFIVHVYGRCSHVYWVHVLRTHEPSDVCLCASVSERCRWLIVLRWPQHYNMHFMPNSAVHIVFVHVPYIFEWVSIISLLHCRYYHCNQAKKHNEV